MNTQAATEGLRVKPVDWDSTKEILRPLFDAGDHWIIVAHLSASSLISTIERKYYTDEKNADLILIMSAWRGSMYGLCAAKKKHMRPYQLASWVRQITGMKIGDSELTTRDLIVTAPPALIPDAQDLAAYLFNGTDLAIAA
jgi:hypothetical protein